MNIPRIIFVSLTALLGGTSTVVADTPHVRGEAIYRNQCAECHGAHGEGVDEEYAEPLYGDRSLKSLTRLIERTMPEEEPALCAGDDAAAVAAYIYDAFYSPEARNRLNPPEILPARLTNRQFRESVADLVGSFTSSGAAPQEDNRRRRGRGRNGSSISQEIREATEGLRAEYYDSKGMNKKDKRHIVRIDSSIDFDFGEGSPDESINAEQFSIAWEGSLIARETGTYEFKVITPNGARLYLNADLKEGDRNRRDDSSAPSQMPLIDAWVSSGEMREESQKLYLLGGRKYLFRLDYFKYKEKDSSIRFEWKPPHGEWTVPSGKDFAPQTSSRVAVVSTPFPADDRSLGYERGAAVSREWFNAVTAAAIEVSLEVEDRIDSLSQSRPNSPDRLQELRSFSEQFIARAHRRPLGEPHRALVNSFFEKSESPEQAVKRAILFAVSSPQFLYPGMAESQPVSGFDVATRLALALWDSIPDEHLLNVAASGGLDHSAGIREQAQRLLNDPRARAKTLAFFHQWLEMDGARDLLKDGDLYPEFDTSVIADLRHSLNLFVNKIVWSEESDYRQLLLADFLFLNERLSLLYGNADSGEPKTGFQQLSLERGDRSGLLTHPYLLSAFAYHNNSSPIHRGVFLTRNIVGRPLKPPPVAIEFKDGDFDPTLTMREKVTEITRDKACMSCHSIINPLGFSLEKYDAIGRLRKIDNNKPINTTSDYTTGEGDKVRFTGPRDVAEFAATNPAAHEAFVTHLFHFTVKQSTAAYGDHILDELRASFAQSDYNIQKLLAEIALVCASHELPSH